MSSGEINRKRVVVSGRVQGVCFRYYTQERARQLHIRGWVRNLHSRQVEAVIEGKGSDISNMIDWMRSLLMLHFSSRYLLIKEDMCI